MFSSSTILSIKWWSSSFGRREISLSWNYWYAYLKATEVTDDELLAGTKVLETKNVLICDCSVGVDFLYIVVGVVDVHKNGSILEFQCKLKAGVVCLNAEMVWSCLCFHYFHKYLSNGKRKSMMIIRFK